MSEESDNRDESTDDSEPQTDSESTLASDLESLQTILHRTATTHRIEVFFEGMLWYLAGAGGVVMTVLLIGLVFPAAVPLWTGWMLTLGGAAVGVAALGGLIRFFMSSPSAEGIARRLQDVEPSFRNDLVAALEFAEMMLDRPEASDEALGFSRRLARQHVRKTVEAVRERKEGLSHLGPLLPDRHFEPPLLAVVGCLTLLAGSAMVAPESTADILRSPLSMTAETEEDGTRVRPIVGDIRLTYDPPDYTGIGKQAQGASTGHIETIVGSEVTLETYPLLEMEDVEMVIENGDDRRVVSLDAHGRNRLSKSFVVTDPGQYYFRARLPNGERVKDGTKRQIDLIQDQSPSVTITSHEGEVEVSPEDVLEIEFSVEDDYGIDSVERIHYFAGSKDRKTVEPVRIGSLSDTPKEVDGTVEFNLRALSLQPKDVVVFQLQAKDNNSRTGPGVGESQRLTLRVSSPEDKHLENIDAQRELSEKLVGMLADYLENPVGERERQDDDTYRQVVSADIEDGELRGRLDSIRQIHRNQGEVLDEMKSLVKRLNEDPLATDRDRSLFDSLHEHLRELHDEGTSTLAAIEKNGELPSTIPRRHARRTADYAADAEDRYEKTILRLQELIASQKMDTVQATREDIKEAKERLKELLERYKETEDPELKKAIRREIDRMRQRISEMMQRMQMQIRDLPEQHVNKDALKKAQLESGTKKMSDNLSEIEKKLDEGDIDGAMEALEEMGKNLDSLGEDMDQQFESAQPEGLSKLDKEISEMMDKVNDLEAAEQELEKETEELQREQKKKRDEQIKEMLDEFTDRLLKKVDRQLDSMDAIQRQDLETHEQSGFTENRQTLQKLRKMLEQNDIEQSLEAAEESIDNLETLRFNLGLAERHSRTGSQRSEDVDRAAEEVREMIPRGKEIKRELEKMMEQARSKLQKPNQQQMKELSQKQKKLREQAQKLRQQMEKSSKEFPMMKQQLKPGMKKAEQKMKEAEKRLGQGESQGALDSERSALEQLGQLKQSMKRTIKRQRSKGKEGRGKMKKDRVDIPGDEDGESHEALREDVMEGMKEEKIEKYDDEIKQYYKSLVE